MIDVTDYRNEIIKYEERVKSEGLECDVYKMAGAFYEQHKQNHGSYKPLIKEGKYAEAMSGRYEWVLDRVKETLDCKIDMEGWKE